MQPTLERHDMRAQGYAFLSACYYAPDAALLEKVAGEGEAVLPGLLPGGEALFCAPRDLDAMRQDFVRLFIGPFKALAPPVGSVYLEAQARLMGESSQDAAQWYRQDGLNPVLAEPPDHICTELEYLYVLALRAASAFQTNQSETLGYYVNRERGFLATHTARWLAHFAPTVVAQAETAFYRALATTTHAFVADVCKGKGMNTSD